MRLAPLDAAKIQVYNDMWKYCDNPMSGKLKPLVCTDVIGQGKG